MKSYKKKKDKKGATISYRTPSPIKASSKYGKTTTSVSGQSQVAGKQSGFKVQHKG